MKRLKMIQLAAALFALLFLLSACGQEDETSSSSLKEVQIGIGNAYKPYCYLDEKGELVGYDVDVLKEMNKKLPQYKFTFNQMEPKNILISVQSGKLDVGAYQIEWNPQRAEQFLFSDVATDSYDLRLVVKAGRSDIQSLEDLKDKKVFAFAGTNNAYILEQYNKKHNNPFNLILASPADFATIVNNIDNGTWDAFIDIERGVEELNGQYGKKLQIVGDVVAPSNAYHIFNKSKTQLKTEFEKALNELKADGTLKALSEKHLGGDFTTPSQNVK